MADSAAIVGGRPLDPPIGSDLDDPSFPRPSTLPQPSGKRYGMGDGATAPPSAPTFPSARDTKDEPGAAPRSGTEGTARIATSGRGGANRAPSSAASAARKKFRGGNVVIGAEGGASHDGVGDPPSLGAARIISERGLMMRITFDIDAAELLLGRLKPGDIPQFAEKRWLPPLPLPAEAVESDSYVDDERIGVFRYRIMLTAEDKRGSGKGWSISL